MNALAEACRSVAIQWRRRAPRQYGARRRGGLSLPYARGWREAISVCGDRGYSYLLGLESASGGHLWGLEQFSSSDRTSNFVPW
jgi:hypothetical protein